MNAPGGAARRFYINRIKHFGGGGWRIKEVLARAV
jgi:hypothetical protein